MKKFLLFVIILLGINFFLGYRSFTNEIFTNEPTVIIVEKGGTFGSLGKYIDGLNSVYYKIYLKNNTPSFSLQAGMYEIERDATLEKIFENLKKPISTESKITILEGWNIFDIDEYLSNKGYIQKGEYIKKASEDFYEYKKDYPSIADASTLEGFLYPDTYNINPNNVSVDVIIRKQLDAFNAKVADKIEAPYYGSIELLDIINLASIVEKEEKNKDAKPIVAGILKKRLEAGWMIGADATVCYPYKLTSEECKMVVSKYIRDKNTYNTRTMTGLPETPISNPSAETIFSVINSKKTEYWFYLHGSDGKIHYGKTNAEHEANKKYLR